MLPIPSQAERSVRRSRNRLRVLLLLASLGEAYVGQIARSTGIERKRVVGSLVGDGDHAPSLSLSALGLVVERREGRGRVFAITSRGRRKARSLARLLARSRPLDAAVLTGPSVASPSRPRRSPRTSRR